MVSFVRKNHECQIRESTCFSMQYSFEESYCKTVSAQTVRIVLKKVLRLLRSPDSFTDKRSGLNILTGSCISV